MYIVNSCQGALSERSYLCVYRLEKYCKLFTLPLSPQLLRGATEAIEGVLLLRLVQCRATTNRQPFAPLLHIHAFPFPPIPSALKTSLTSPHAVVSCAAASCLSTTQSSYSVRRVCKQTFDRSQNTASSCRYHPSHCMGAETIQNILVVSLSLFRASRILPHLFLIHHRNFNDNKQ